MTPPTIQITHSLHEEIGRILFTSASLAHDYNNPANPGRQYLRHNFYILPKLPTNPPTNTILFPDLPYHTIPNYWTTLATLPTSVPFTAHSDLHPALNSLLSPLYNSSHLAQTKLTLHNSLQQYFPTFWTTLTNIYPTQTQRVKSITIHLTQYGSIASFSKITPHNSHMHIYLRTDANFSHLAEVIILSLVKSELENMGWLWPQIQSHATHLLTNSSLTNTLPTSSYTGYHPTITSTQHGRYKQLTQDYLTHLSLAHLQDHPLQLKNNQILLHNQPTDIFGPKETSLLTLLLSNPGTTVSFERILNHLWPNNYEASQSRITKLIERIRAKLRTQNISPTLIQAVRGHGYTIT